MKTKIFDGKKITIRKFSKKDLRKVKKFQALINSLIKEKALVNFNKKFSFEQEKKWLEEQFKKMESHKSVYLIAETNNMVAGSTQIYLNEGRGEHVGNFGIIIRKGYRGIGLGSYLTGEVIKLAKKELKPKPKIIKLDVFPINKPAIALYKKYNFKKVAVIPKQREYLGKLYDEIIMLLYL
ncbi:MAG TPA: GNAT family N-acetyltransferase [Candidatus Humimicrobiaceae bacterium]|nr:GNAT family N-acetyltransferase [Candidatus Humimicrobiaceae bacterium]